MEYKFTQKASVIQTLLDKIQAMPSVEAINQLISDVATLAARITFPDNYLPKQDQIFREDSVNAGTYPVIHPNITAKGEKQSYRLGETDVFEVLVRNGDTASIPEKAIIFSATGFTDELCTPVIVTKIDGDWVITDLRGESAPKSVIIRYAVP